MELNDRFGLLHKASSLVESALARAETEEELDRISAAAGEALGRSLTDAGPLFAQSLRDRAEEMLQEHAEYRRSFEGHLEATWGKALNAYYSLYIACVETGEDFNSVQRPMAAVENDLLFEALTGLHGRCCRVASEVFALLRTGHPAGAMARWRTMHECSVYAAVLGQYGRSIEMVDLAERYVLHDVMINLKDAQDYQRYAKQLGFESFSEDEVTDMRRWAKALLVRFGDDYGKQYGWARPLFPGKGLIQFPDLERAANLDHLRPYYGMANHDVHADSKGARLNRLSFRGGQLLLVGPTNAGLADPGQSAAISLLQTTLELVLHGRPSLSDVSDVMIMKALSELCRDVCDEFIAAHEKLEAEEAAVQAELGLNPPQTSS